MDEISPKARAVLSQIIECVQIGKANSDTNIPSGTRGQPGVAEFVEEAIQQKLPPKTILEQGLTIGMSAIGKKFAANEVFVPEVLIAARAMHAGMQKLKPLFLEQGIANRSVFIIGTVKGDLHDIGKNLVAMMLEGAGWKVIDLGVDCPADRFAEAVAQHPGCAVGLSALLTTTMVNMRETVQTIRARFANTVILVGGAPVNDDFARQIGATGYAADPSKAVELLNRLAPAA